jgi:proteasome lid subunit RPN8/RPN11
MRADASLILPAAVRDAIERHARDGAPEEVCGILVGHRGDREVDGDDPDEVTAHRAVDNVADERRTRYELDPETTLAVIEEIENGGDEVVGFYHSHPTGPLEPSSTDEAQATWPGYVYVIVVPGDGMEAWRWTGERFEPLSLDVV